MISLIVRPARHGAPKPYSLSVRNHGLGGVDYDHIAYLDVWKAYTIVDAGFASFLYGDPRYQTTPAPKPVYKPYWTTPTVKPKADLTKIGPCKDCGFNGPITAYCKGMVCPRRDELAEAGLI